MIGLGISYFGILLAFTICVIFKTICVNVSHFVRSRQLGCKPAFTRPSRLPFGIDILKRALDATKDQRLQDDDLKVYEELGQRATWNQNILGSWHHVTSDPNNIQAILAKQFNDFDLGPIRRGSFAPLIGHGIFTSDGEDWYAISLFIFGVYPVDSQVGSTRAHFSARNSPGLKLPTFNWRTTSRIFSSGYLSITTLGLTH
jgi:hypothetical protein